MTLTGYSLAMGSIAEPVRTSETSKWFGGLAKEMATSIIFGAVHLTGETGVAQNTLSLARADGTADIVYCKIHPFTYVGEDKVLKAGESVGMIDVAGLRCSCAICYDLRFPEIFSVIASQCNAMINIANWPAKRVDHWKALLIARAIENQYFVIGVNRIGTDGNGLQYVKSSMVVSPEGTVMRPLFSESEVDVYELDLKQVTEYRISFPTIQDKRFSLYGRLIADRIC
jgi:predicted amidohydrolase